MLSTTKYRGVIKFKKLYYNKPKVTRSDIRNRLIHLKEALPYTSEDLLYKVYDSATSKCWNDCNVLGEEDGWTTHSTNYSYNRYFSNGKVK